MIEKIIDKFTKSMSIEQEFDEKAFTLTVTTWFGNKLVHKHVSEMEPMYKAFEKRMKK